NSDHHMSPHNDYPSLQLDVEEMPFLPYPLPIMGVIALVPQLWFRRMNPLCSVWNVEPGEIGEVRPQGRNRSGKPGAHLAQSAYAQRYPS
ncbi:MAG: hypothetical protein AAF280_12985, partial [Pseudomonadota bacterium]